MVYKWIGTRGSGCSKWKYKYDHSNKTGRSYQIELLRGFVVVVILFCFVFQGIFFAKAETKLVTPFLPSLSQSKYTSLVSNGAFVQLYKQLYQQLHTKVFWKTWYVFKIELPLNLALEPRAKQWIWNWKGPCHILPQQEGAQVFPPSLFFCCFVNTMYDCFQ